MSGLVIGLCIFTMFALMIHSISHQDLFHKNADRIYAVVQVLSGGQEGDQHSAITPSAMIPALKNEFPEIEKTAGYCPAGRMIVKYQDRIFYESRIRFVDPEFLSMFSFKLVAGEKNSVLSGANSIVLTEDSALKYFGDEDPIGRTLTLDNKTDVMVTGIAENVPENSSINFDFLVSIQTARSMANWIDDWKTNNRASFLLLTDGVQSDVLENKLAAFRSKYFDDSSTSPKRLYLHPLRDFGFNSAGIDCYWNKGNISFIAIWVIAVLLLLIACINFMNISTARYVTRAHEVGMRKVVGARRSHLIKQFLGESVLMALISLPFAIVLFNLLRPLFSEYLGPIFDVSLLETPSVLILLFVVTILTGLFAGSYPAFYLSAFKPVTVLQKRFVSGKKGSRLRKILVVVQFTFSLILILMTVISVKQSHQNIDVDLGFNRSNILAVTMTKEARGKVDVLKNELLRNKDILSVSASTALPIEWNTENRIVPEGYVQEDSFTMNTYGIDYGMLEMLEIAFLEGRDFSEEFNDEGSFIINKSARQALKWDNPIGKRMEMDGRQGTVIGVVEDFHFKAIFLENISSAVLYINQENLNYLLLKYTSPDSLPGVTEFVEEQWSFVLPNAPFEAITLENAFQDNLRGDLTSEMTGALGGLAILLSCLGLFGLSSYSVERRIKEIGIRKVMG
ncbi:MAG: ABC transporter permease, partial [Candidatus Aminicenantes bacterium]|nr:ABC transporter permease [Candidatus Aminicenantes bacterium]